MSLGVAFGWHVHPFEDLLALVRRAEALGYRAAYVDGDVSLGPSSLASSQALDGWTVTTGLLARTERIEIGSIRLVHHWNVARLAQAVATLEQIAPSRVRFFISIGAQPADQRFGLRWLPASDRIRWLEETLTALRALWAGETVRMEGRFVQLDGARVRPVPRDGRIPIEVAARRKRLLRVVAAHADCWNVNLPPVRSRVDAATHELELSCRAHGRDPSAVARSMWIFTRLAQASDFSSLRKEFRRLNPWFRDLRDEELEEAIVAGPAEACRGRIDKIRRELRLELPVVDLSGLGFEASWRLLEALAPGEPSVDSGSWSA